ncbi:MAG: transporter substrate-binding domain-containing protein [Oceanospirillaceae bacterium]|nr:transporter substrate-binding domain-containing protein [Oceanospirillaceae bacterium]
MKFLYFFTASLYFVFCGSSYAESLVFAKSGPLDYSADISETILKEAYGRLNIHISTEVLPSERALLNANSGLLDGDIHRIIGLENLYLNLIRVPVPINAIEGMVFSKTKGLKIDSWDDLKYFSIGLRIGAKFAEAGTQGMNVSPAPTNDLVFKMLDRGRTEVVVSTRIEGLLTSKKLGLANIYPIEPAIVNLKLYHYVRKKNKALIPELTRILKIMEKEGRILEIKKTAIVELLRQ